MNSIDSDTSSTYDDFYASYRELKAKSKYTKTIIQIKILLDMFEDFEECDAKEKCLEDIRYFLNRLEKTI